MDVDPGAVRVSMKNFLILEVEQSCPDGGRSHFRSPLCIVRYIHKTSQERTLISFHQKQQFTYLLIENWGIVQLSVLRENVEGMPLK
jgi:hypothetical protein